MQCVLKRAAFQSFYLGVFLSKTLVAQQIHGETPSHGDCLYKPATARVDRGCGKRPPWPARLPPGGTMPQGAGDSPRTEREDEQTQRGGSLGRGASSKSLARPTCLSE